MYCSQSLHGGGVPGNVVKSFGCTRFCLYPILLSAAASVWLAPEDWLPSDVSLPPNPNLLPPSRSTSLHKNLPFVAFRPECR